MDYVGYERDTQVGKTERVGGVLQLVAGLGQGVCGIWHASGIGGSNFFPPGCSMMR